MKLWLVDDAVLIREGLVGLLERQGHEVTEVFSDADALRARGLSGVDLPEAVITDVRMPPQMADDGLRAALDIRARRPQLPVMVLSQYLAPAYAQHLFSAEATGGTGYLLKESVGQVSDFLDALTVVASGGVVVDPEVAARMMGQDKGIQSLTQRERDVLTLMAQGLSNTQIAERLVVSQAAVGKHVSNIFQGLGLHHGEDNRRVRAILRYLSATGGLV